ncbi:MAG: uracil-DNA glycosylase [Planctomycetota bacterium]
MTTDPQTASRLARRAADTARLMGVDFIPVAGSAPPPPPTPAPAPALPDATDPEDRLSRADRAVRLTDLPPVTDVVAALDELRARYERESVVAQRMEGWTNIVFGDGDPHADLVFVGEAPGANEDEQGIPFVGRAGQKLNEMITAMGLSRETVYICNVLKVRPPGNRTPTSDESALDGVFLDEQLAILNPKVIVTLGKPAAAYILGTSDAMGRLRGNWHDYRGVPVMPTFHPAYLLRAYTKENRERVWSDLQQVMEKLAT